MEQLDRQPRLSRRDPDVAAIIRAWRGLTSDKSRRSGRRLGSGMPTLVACSGGADSSALALALAAGTRDLVIAHVVHDMRQRDEALADRDAVRRLAESLGLPFVEAEVSVKRADASGSNTERIARDRRYEALARLAAERRFSHVAVAHQAQDQVETILMRLMRGAGPEGLRGIAPKLPLVRGEAPVWLIRPMLGVRREDAERLCRLSDWTWQEDATNQDVSRLRSALRNSVVPALRERSPRLDERLAATAELMRGASEVVRRRAKAVSRRALIEVAPNAAAGTAEAESTMAWSRDVLRSETGIVVGLVLREAFAQLFAGRRRDRFGHEALRRLVDAIRDSCRDPRRFGLSGIEVSVLAERVEARRIQE